MTCRLIPKNRGYKQDQINWKLTQIFPSPPIIAYRANPSLKKKLVRAKLKPLNNEKKNSRQTSPPLSEPQIKPNHPFNLSQSTSHIYRNPIKWHGKNMPLFANTKSFDTSTKSTKIPIDPLPPNLYYNCQSTIIVYLITCNYENCCTIQRIHIEKTTWEALWAQNIRWKPITKPLLHTQPFAVQTGCTNTQVPPNEPNPELWLKRQEYYWICKFGANQI